MQVEIVKQIVKQAKWIVQDAFSKKNSDAITLAGKGEPLDNYEASLCCEAHTIPRASFSLSRETGSRRAYKKSSSEGLYASRF